VLLLNNDISLYKLEVVVSSEVVGLLSGSTGSGRSGGVGREDGTVVDRGIRCRKGRRRSDTMVKIDERMVWNSV